MAVVAESVGFDSIWVGDHLLMRGSRAAAAPWEAWSVLAALAEATDRVLLGPLVAATSFHNPGVLAKKAATIDEISGGRFILGLGAGWNQIEYDAFGFPFDHRASRFEEAFTIIRTLVREGWIDYTGRYYTLRDAELLPRARPDLPIMVGAIGPRLWNATLPYIDMWNGWYAWFRNRPQDLTALLEHLKRACTDVGRDPRTLTTSVAVAVQLPDGKGRESQYPTPKGTVAIKGTIDQIAASLMGFLETEVDQLKFVVDPINASSIETLGEVLRVIRRSWTESSASSSTVIPDAERSHAANESRS